MSAVDAKDTELVEFLAGVIGAVEANSYETLCLWQEYHQQLGKPWVQSSRGLIEKIGALGDMPVVISLFTNVVDGHKILFWHVTSQVADYRMVDEWLAANLPASAFRDGSEYANKTDAMNFCNLFPHAALASQASP